MAAASPRPTIPRAPCFHSTRRPAAPHWAMALAADWPEKPTTQRAEHQPVAPPAPPAQGRRWYPLAFRFLERGNAVRLHLLAFRFLGFALHPEFIFIDHVI